MLLGFDIGCEEIAWAIKNLKPSGEPGIDGLPPIFVKECAVFLLQPLQILFNLSVNTGVMPQVWKNSFITPVFKSGDRSNVSNYRPISLMCSIAKIFDIIMTRRIQEGFILCIIKEQHGFMSRRSILTNLIIYSDYISNSLDCYKQVDSVCLDFKEAFDTVDHDILLYKLHKFGMRVW